MRVTEDNTDLRRGKTLASQLKDVIVDLISRDLKPAGSGALVGKGRSGWEGIAEVSYRRREGRQRVQ